MNAIIRYYFKARREYKLSPAQAWAEALAFYGACDTIILA